MPRLKAEANPVSKYAAASIRKAVLVLVLFFASVCICAETSAASLSAADPGTDIFDGEDIKDNSVEFIYDREGGGGSYVISFSYGFRNIAKTGRKLPFEVHITNNTSEDTAAILTVGIPGSIETNRNEFDDALIEYTFDANIPSGATADIRSTLSVAAGISNPVELRLTDSDGRLLGEGQTSIDLRNTEGMELLIGILSDTPERLGYFDGISIGGSSLRTRTVELDALSMPDSATGLEQLDVLLISNFDTLTLGEEVRAAIRSWLSAGGVLLAGTGGSTDISLISEEKTELTVSDAEKRTVNMGLKYSKQDPDDAVITLDICNVYVSGGIQVMQSDDIAMLTSISDNNGVIGITAYDLCDISDFCTEEIEYTEDLLRNLLGTSRLSRLGSIASGSGELMRNAMQLAGIVDTSALPDASGYVLFAVLYIAVISFVSYLILKSFGMTQFYLLCCPIIAFMASVFIWLAGYGTRKDGIILDYALIRELNDESHTDYGFIRLSSASPDDYSLVLPDGSEVYPIVSESPGPAIRPRGLFGSLSAGNDSDESASGARVGIRESGEGLTISVSEAEPFAGVLAEYSRAFSPDADGAKSGIDADISYFGDNVTGSITNNTGHDLTDMVILMYGKIITCGDLAAGESIATDDLDVVNCPVGDSGSAAGYASGLYGRSSDDREYYRLLKYERLLEYYMEETVRGYYTGARIAAFTDDGELEESFPGIGGSDAGGCMLMVKNAAVLYEKDGNIWSDGMEKEPELISGDYDAMTNTTSGSCILEYSLGTGMDILSLGIERVSDVFDSEEISAFSGTISIYDYSEGGFRQYSAQGADLTGEELFGYLSPSNTITVRYALGADSPSSARYCLPVLSVTGNERD